MLGLSMVFKFVSLSLVIAACIGNANGLNCYTCDVTDDDVQKEPEQTCKYKMARGLTTSCPESSPYCLSVNVTVLGGKRAGFGGCAEEAWHDILGGNHCVPVADVPGFQFKVSDKILTPETGKVCICNTDGCNSDLQRSGTHSESESVTPIPPLAETAFNGSISIMFRNFPASKPFALFIGSST